MSSEKKQQGASSPVRFEGQDAEVLGPLAGDDGLWHFPSAEDQAFAELLLQQLDQFSKHSMRVAGTKMNGPDIQRYGKLSFLHIVGHALQTLRESWLYEIEKRTHNAHLRPDIQEMMNEVFEARGELAALRGAIEHFVKPHICDPGLMTCAGCNARDKAYAKMVTIIKNGARPVAPTPAKED